MQRYTVHFIWKLLYMFRVVLSGRSRPDNTQTGTRDTQTNRGHTATNPKKTNDEAAADRWWVN
jgi:hypothetical protein